MNNQMQFSSYQMQPQKQIKDHSVIVLIIGIVLSVIVGFVGVVMLFVTAIMGFTTEMVEGYDEVSAVVVSSERKWSSSDDEYRTECEIVYHDKNGVEYHGTISGDHKISDKVTIYCDPENYSTMVYISDPETVGVVADVLKVISFVVLGFAAVMLAASIIIFIVMKSRYKKRLAEAAALFSKNMSGQNIAQQETQNNQK